MRKILLIAATCAIGCSSTPIDPTVASLTSEMRDYANGYVEKASIRHSFHESDGASVDCVVRERQPAVLARGLASVATPPPDLPVAPGLADFALPGGADDEGNERTCPDGTIPVLRPQLANFSSLAQMYRKSARGGDTNPACTNCAAGSTASHQYGAAYQKGLQADGIQSVLNLWNNYVEQPEEFSLSQLWAVSHAGGTITTWEAGWQHCRNLYGNELSHLFIYSTWDNYQLTGCYNLDCPNFVQTNSGVLLGGSFAANSQDASSVVNGYSAAGGAQKDFQINYYNFSGDWWLYINGKAIGYYPASLYPSSITADEVEFGGEITDDNSGGHTTTQMGSGAFASAWYSQAAYQRQLYYLDANTWQWSQPGLHPGITDAYCYSEVPNGTMADPYWKTSFFFGGPGYNLQCQ
jgi:hypothetical protein